MYCSKKRCRFSHIKASTYYRGYRTYTQSNGGTKLMNKIKIEELAPYLPYGLRIKEGNNEFELTGTFLDEWFNYGDAMKGKPLLRPIHLIKNENIEFIREFFDIGNTEISLETWIGYVLADIKTGLLSFKQWNILYKYHYDVFRLIDKGLAFEKY